MSEQSQSAKPFDISVIGVIRKVIQFLSFLLVNYIALELIFKAQGEFSEIGTYLRVLPFLQTARNPWTAGAGLTEYTFYTINQGKIPFFFLAVIAFLGLFTGRFFCGWVCPTGFIQDLLGGLANENMRLSVEADKSMKKFKFWLLALMLILFAPLGYYYVNDTTRYFDFSIALGDLVQNPLKYFSLSEFFFVTFPGLVKHIIENLNMGYIFNREEPWKGVLFMVYIFIVAICVYKPRFYCSYLCPYAALISIFSDYSFLKLQRLPTRCPGRKECGVCERVCDMQVRILDEPASGFTGEGECTLCLTCLDKCPHNAIKFKFGF
jgi:polyferredoxin